MAFLRKQRKTLRKSTDTEFFDFIYSLSWRLISAKYPGAFPCPQGMPEETWIVEIIGVFALKLKPLRQDYDLFMNRRLSVSELCSEHNCARYTQAHELIAHTEWCPHDLSRVLEEELKSRTERYR